MQNNNSGAIIVVLLGFILLGILIYHTVELTATNKTLILEKEGLIQQIEELEKEKNSLQEALQNSSMDLETAKQEIEEHNKKVGFVRNQLFALGLWDNLDENSKLILTDLSKDGFAPPLPPQPEPNENPIPKKEGLDLGWMIRLTTNMIGMLGCVALIFWGWKKSKQSKNVFRMKVTRKEAEVLNHLRRHRYF
jgi:hypothetical protein